ncbi:hypothetical protein ADK53_28710 [Streptomyces sp. WM6373]|uniref:hypothetical protein n=1 Tax=Streptomyces sp. WM6373 TaxID=1415556 RepID=UPI0006AD9181|nr:hypothetical protein [Streptomyces sp. WM6373]KOU30202.1 hypothetical protein ADK53_28710 [Streptomyces sp. WM6373]
MSKLTKRVADALIQTGARRGRFGFHAANAVCATLLGRYVQVCDDGPDCADPDHEHVDFQLRD